MTMDLDHEVGQAEACLSSATLFVLDRSKEDWFLRRLDEETITSAIEQLQAVLVLKRKTVREAA